MKKTLTVCPDYLFKQNFHLILLLSLYSGFSCSQKPEETRQSTRPAELTTLQVTGTADDYSFALQAEKAEGEKEVSINLKTIRTDFKGKNYLLTIFSETGSYRPKTGEGQLLASKGKEPASGLSFQAREIGFNKETLKTKKIFLTYKKHILSADRGELNPGTGKVRLFRVKAGLTR